MRRTAMAVLTVAALMVALSGTAFAATTTAILNGTSAGEDALYGSPGNDTVYSVGDNAGNYVDCGTGTDTVKKGSDQNLDRFVGCERFTS
jgi:Ca2+-binding RTX toxin-like protein